MIAVIDYGAGNLRSVQNALAYLGAESVVTGDPDTIRAADKVVLPGVGAFGDAMKSLRAAGLEDTIKTEANKGKPFLGICLGLHLLFEESEESPGVKGLGILKGRVVKIPQKDRLKIPHMGWNSIQTAKGSRLFQGLPEEPCVYFVNSYYINAAETDIVCATTAYGGVLEIAVEKGDLFAVQFHPEKSGKTGLKILKNFAELEV